MKINFSGFYAPLLSRAAAPFYLVVLLWLLYPYLIAYGLLSLVPEHSTWSTLGTYGDSFGALNTLFSGLALAGLALNIYLQSSQIRKFETREQQIETERIRLSLYERRFQVYDRAVRFVLSIIEDSETFNDENSKKIRQDFIIASRESRFLFGIDSEIFKSLSKVDDDAYNIVWHRETIELDSEYDFTEEEKDKFRSQIAYLNDLLPTLEDYFSSYLDFSKTGVIQN